MRRRGLIVAIAIVALCLVVARAAASVYTDRLWFQGLGAEALWQGRALTMLWLTLGSAAVTFTFAFLNLFAVRHSVVALILPRRVGNLEFGEEVPGGRLVAAAALIAALLAAFLTFPADRWADAMLAMRGVRFGEGDPYFQHDLGYFVAWLPFEQALHQWATIVVAAVSVTVVLLYALTPSLRWTRQGLRVTAYVRRHITILGGVLLLLLAWSYRLDMYLVLADGSGVAGSFTAIDHAVRIPGSLILATTTLAGALVVLWAGWSGQPRLAFFAVTVVLVLALGIRQVAPLAADWMALGGGARERPYVETRAGYTRRAYAVDQVRLGAGAPLYPSVAAAAPGVSAWDTPLLATLRGLPPQRIVWRALPGGIAAYAVEGGDAGEPLAALPLDPAATDPALGAGMAGGGGEPRALAVPVVSDSARGHQLVPDTTGIASSIGVGSALRRTAAALALRDPRLLMGEPAGRRPGVIPVRDVGGIVERLVPFFTQGAPVPVVDRDSLRWVVPLYSASATYPLSARVFVGGKTLGYLQRAGLAVVDAATGSVGLFADSIPDPVAATWRRRFPGLLAPWSELPEGVRSMLPPPAEWVRAQLSAFAEVGTRAGGGGGLHPPPLDGADSAAGRDVLPPVAIDGRLARVIPLLDREEHVAGLVVSVGGAVPATWWVPAPAAPVRWGQLVDRLRAGPASGVRGSVRAVPLAGAPAFVQSLYGGPTGVQGLREVRLLAGDSVAAAPTLRGLVGITVPAAEPDFRASLTRWYDAMRAAMRRGDWSAFGAAMDSIGRALGRGGR